jgi:hypothetical protein
MEEVFGKKFETHKVIEYYEFNPLKEPVPVDEKNEFTLLPFLFNPPVTVWNEKKRSESKEDFELNKTNTLCRLEHKRLSVFVVKNENKVTLKYFLYTRLKGVGKKYYKVSTNCSYISYNIKKNCLYVGSINNFHKKRKASKSVRIFTFTTDIVRDKISSINLLFNHIFEDHPDKKINVTIGHDVFREFLSHIPKIRYEENKISTQSLYGTILNNKGVKLCDNWGVFSNMWPQPKTVDYKKYGPKYLDLIMKLNGLSGDKIKRVLHRVKHFNVNFFRTASNLFGKDFILGQSDDVVQSLFESTVNSEPRMDFSVITSKKERNNIFEIFKLVAKNEVDLHTFSDHITFIKNIRRFEEVRWESTTYDEFREEHLNLTERNQYYTKGTFRRIYGDRFEDYLSQPIKDGDNTYYPVILKTSKEYNTESFVQSNCVKGYIQRAEALIVSFRKNDPESKERATVEYKISKNETVELQRVQTRGRFNKDLDYSWEIPLQILDKRMFESTEYNLFELPKIVCKVGNKEFISESMFEKPQNYSNLRYQMYLLNTTSILVWDNDKILNIDYSGNDLVTFLEDDLNF